jgi:signal transduction histidine kinase
MVALFTTSVALAQTSNPPTPGPLTLTDAQDKYPLGLHLDILKDPSEKLTIQEVSSPEFDTRFLPSQVAVPNFGFTNSAIWVRLQLRNETTLTNHWLLQVGFANMQYVDLYTPSTGGEGFSVKQSGTLRPASTRDILYPFIVFQLSVPTLSQQTYYLRFQSGASMTLPLTLWTQSAFSNQSLGELIAHGIFFGVLIGLLFYNLFLLFSLREVSYFYFVIFLASMIIEEASYAGYLGIYVTPSRYFEPLTFSLLIASIVLFSDSFLEMSTRSPKFHWASLVLLAGWGALVLLTPFTSYYSIARPTAILALVSLMLVWIAGILSWRMGFRLARFFLIAWFGLIVSTIWILLVRLGITRSTFISENAYLLGFLWLAVCWSIALADRINLLKAETEGANRALQSSEHRLSQILEGLPLGVVVYGKDRKPSYANNRSVDILSNPTQGIQADVSAGRTLENAIDYFSLQMAGSGQAYPIENFPINSALHGEPASVEDIEANLGDRRVPLEIWASPIRDDTGNVEAAVAAFQDITQRKQTEAELMEYRKSLETLVEKRTAELSDTNEQLNLEATERKKLEKSLLQRIEWLSALNQNHQAISGMADLPQTDETLSVTILQLLEAETVIILRWDEHGEQIKVFCRALQEGPSPDLESIKAFFQKDSPLRQDIELGKTILLSSEQAASLPTPLGADFKERGVQSLILSPMIAHHAVFGVLGIAAPKPVQDFTSYQIDLVERMALDLADLAQDALLLDQALTLATSNERNRLARDLHDSVTQVLFSANLVAEVLPQIWRRDPERAMQSLDKLRRLARGALAEMRTMLLELRPAAVVNTPLADLLGQLTEAVTSRTGLPFKLYLERIPPLPDNVHTNFYRIAQEALNNVVKHAQATRVTVSLSATPLSQESNGGLGHEVRLVIYDDGVGYPAWDEQSAGLGIGIMRERAATIGAALSLESKPGHGTRVSLIWRNESGNQ